MSSDFNDHRFPVKSPTACQLKWSWSSLYLNKNTTASCHRVNEIPFTVDNFENFHNLPKKLSDRQLMQQGKRPVGGCEYCFDIEDAGGVSDRMIHLDHDTVPYELYSDPNATEVTPGILEVYFNNTCNLRCTYCGPWFSSQILAEYKKFGPFKQEGVDLTVKPIWENNTDYDIIVEKLFKWLEQHSWKLKRFHILGGEPFYQREFIRCLDHFEKHPNPNLVFVIVTNLMVTSERIDEYIDKFKNLIKNKCIGRLQITASLDCWGPQAEYLRYGLKLSQWEENFEKLVKLKWIKLQINNAVSAMSIPYMLPMLERINKWKQHRQVYYSFMSVNRPFYMNPNIFGDIFREDFEKILQLMPDQDPLDLKNKQYMEGISKEISSRQPNLEQIKNLKIFLEEIDQRRKTDYKKLWPWLKDEFDKHLGPSI